MLRRKKPLTPDQLKEKLRNDFLAACESGKRADVEKFLKQGADVNATSDIGRSALYYAVMNGNVDTVRVLLENGANPNRRTSDGQPHLLELGESTPLTLAAQRNYEAIAYLLVSHGADVNAKDSHDLTPLHYAAKRGNLDLALHLVRRGAEIEPRDEWNNTPEHYARSNGHQILANQLLKLAGKTPPPPKGPGF